MNNIPEFSVTEISNLTKNILEENFNLIKVRGEISSVKKFKGHLYFSLKDDSNILNAVCWSSKVPFLQIQPEDGIEVVAEGKISTYSKSSISTYQIQISQIEIKGEGALLKLFEQRKKKLESEGLFNDKYKKKIPFLPKNIGVITSPSGAVIMDIINRIQARFPTNIKLFPVSVQGSNASQEIIDGISYFEKNEVDTVIIARGGGGVEDLMPFNDENLIRKVFDFKIPLISAVGHETDFTLLDFVSDLRAATPTAAAELAVPDMTNLKEKCEYLFKSLSYKLNYFIKLNFKNFQKMNLILNLKNISKLINEHKKNIKNLSNSLNFYTVSFLKIKKKELQILNSSLKNLNMDNILKRGFVLLKGQSSNFIKSPEELKKNKNIDIQFFNKLIKTTIKIKE